MMRLRSRAASQIWRPASASVNGATVPYSYACVVGFQRNEESTVRFPAEEK
jgi:hypothetical protein